MYNFISYFNVKSYETYFNGFLISENIKINTKTMLIAVLEHEIWQKPVQPAVNGGHFGFMQIRP